MRVGTWNLEGRWDSRHLALIEAMDCDVLLLTEVREDVAIPGFNVHLGGLEMGAWATLCCSRRAAADVPAA